MLKMAMHMADCLYYDENVLFQMDTFSAVYKKLTGKDVIFEFPEFVL